MLECNSVSNLTRSKTESATVICRPGQFVYTCSILFYCFLFLFFFWLWRYKIHSVFKKFGSVLVRLFRIPVQFE